MFRFTFDFGIKCKKLGFEKDFQNFDYYVHICQLTINFEVTYGIMIDNAN